MPSLTSQISRCILGRRKSSTSTEHDVGSFETLGGGMASCTLITCDTMPMDDESCMGDDQISYSVASESATEAHPRIDPDYPPHYFWRTRSSLYRALNRGRNFCGSLPPLRRDMDLEWEARKHARDMVGGLRYPSTREFDDGDVIRVGANVCRGRKVSGGHLARSTMSRDSWDRANVMDEGFTHVGIGTYEDRETGVLYMCQIFVERRS